MIRRICVAMVSVMTLSSCATLGFAGSCDGTEVIGMFDQVGDLVEASNVQSSDVVVGSVQQIERDGWHAKVTMCLQAGEKVSEDVEAVVRTTSLLGEKFIDLKPASFDPPYLEDGAILGTDQTSKATELEDVFAKLATILGTSNLEQINRFTHAQAKILRERAAEFREVLGRLRSFTDVLVGRKDEIASGIDSLDSVAGNLLDNQAILTDFLDSFADSSGVLADQKEELTNLLVALDDFSEISVRLLNATEEGLTSQFEDLRPVLRTAVENSQNLEDSLQTLATFAEYFPETIPGDYIQLDVCQAAPEDYSEGPTCPQADTVKGSDSDGSGGDASGAAGSSRGGAEDLEFILRMPLGGGEG